MKRLYLIGGPMGVGKTTVCRALQRRLERSVFLDGLRLGKPHSQEEAFAMLSALSGRTHHVCTGVTVCQGGRMETRPETTDVIFRPLTEAEIASNRESAEGYLHAAEAHRRG